MSTIRHTASTTTHAVHSTVHRTTKASAPVAATRANTDPPKLDVKTLTKELGLTEAQRDRVRPIVSTDDRRLSQAGHMRWSNAAARRSALWQVRDDTARDLRRVVDTKQVEKLPPLLGPAK